MRPGFVTLLRFVPVCLAALLCLAGLAHAQVSREAPEPATMARVQGALATRHMVAAAHPLAARTGREILRRGGSAIDAAIAAQMVLNVVEPQSSGIGGGGFLLHWDAPAKKLTSWDGRETAPAAALPTRFLNGDGTPRRWPDVVGTPLAVGVPGLVAMLHAAHAKHGKLAWRDLFADAIALARDGFGVSPRLSAMLARRGPAGFSPAARALFFDADGAPWPLGHVLKNPALAASLERIAGHGPAPLHEGAIADEILAALAGAKGPKSEMAAADLANYRARERPPVCAPYRTVTVCGMGPPSSGGLTVAQTLGLLADRDLGAAPGAAGLHLLLEAEKRAYADRNRYLADPDRVRIPAGWLNPAYLAARSAEITANRATEQAAPGRPPDGRGALPGTDATVEQPGTTHISVVDGDGNAVALTSSIETLFGSGILAGGFLLNNQLTDFSFRDRDGEGRPIANRPDGGKRPRSSMSPTLVFDGMGELKAVLGSPGGSRIILYVVKTLVALIDWGMDAQQAAALVNFGSRNGPAEIEAGPGGDELAAALAALGHKVARPSMTSGVHLIVRTDEGLTGAADPRREGIAIGD